MEITPTFLLTAAIAVFNAIYLFGRWRQGTDIDAIRLTKLESELGSIRAEQKYRSDDAHEIRKLMDTMPFLIQRDVAKEYVSREVFESALKASQEERNSIRNDIQSLWRDYRGGNMRRDS